MNDAIGSMDSKEAAVRAMARSAPVAGVGARLVLAQFRPAASWFVRPFQTLTASVAPYCALTEATYVYVE